MLLACFLTASYCMPAPEPGHAASFSGALPGLQADQIQSTVQMRTALDLITTCFADARDRGQLTFELQKLIIAKSGECISRLSEIMQEMDPAAGGRQEELRALFKQCRDTLTALHDYNQKKVEKLAEDKLDTVADQAAFFASAQWQEPQYLVSLASYWLSWGGYYASLLYPAGDEVRTELLNSAAAGFARTFLDFREETITARSLFGRALCYREMGRYDRALQDMNSVAGKVGKSNPLYARVQYEKIRLSFLAGNYQSVLSQIREFGEDVPSDKVSKQIRDGLMQMQSQIILSGMEKHLTEKNLPPQQYYHQALQELSRAGGTDDAVSAEIYRFVTVHAAEIDRLARSEGAGITDAELGGMGCLALADWHLQQKHYDEALERYRRLQADPERLARRRLDEISYRLAWCLAEKARWAEAAAVIEKFSEKYPASTLAGKAACLQYAAAANAYRTDPSDKNYGRYIASIPAYLKSCSEHKDLSEAHFQLGKHYQKSGRTDDALQQFAQVGSDSPNFLEARYSTIRSNIDSLESSARRGEAGQQQARKLYDATQRQIDEIRPAVQKMKDRSARQEIEAHMVLLQARLLACSAEAPGPRMALQELNQFEARVSGSRQQNELRASAQAVRLEALLRLGQGREAEEEISRFLKDTPDTAEAWPLLNELAGRLYDQSRSLSDTGSRAAADTRAAMALAVYERLLRMAGRLPACEQYRDSIELRTAQLCADTGQLGRARQLYQDRLNRDPTSADAVSGLGLIFEQEHRWDDALAMWRRFGQGMQQGSYHWFEARYRTARCLGMIGKPAEGCQVLTTTEVLHPALRDEDYKQRFLVLQKELCGKG
jgi:TolA-binding protein